MTRGQVKDVIRKRKEERWVEDMVKKGIPLKHCDVCARLRKVDHQCWPTKYTVPGPHGSQKQIVFSATGRGMALKEQPYVDVERVTGEYERMTSDRRQSAERAEAYQDMLRRKEQQDSIQRMEASNTSTRNQNGNQNSQFKPVVTPSTIITQSDLYLPKPTSSTSSSPMLTTKVQLVDNALHFIETQESDKPMTAQPSYARRTTPHSSSSKTNQPFQGTLGQ